MPRPTISTFNLEHTTTGKPRRDIPTPSRYSKVPFNWTRLFIVLANAAGVDHTGLDVVPLLATYGILGRTSDARNRLEVRRTRWQQCVPVTR